MAASLVLMHAFVHAVGFRGQHGPAPHRSGRPPEFLCRTLPGYAIVLLAALHVLWTFGRLHGLPARALARGGGWLVPFRTVNDGPAPAAQVRVEAVLALGDGRQERGEVVIDYLAARSAEEGGFLFAADPGAGRLAARPMGFARP